QSFFREPARERHEFMHLLWSAGAQGFARPAPLWLACFFADLNRLGCYFADERVVAAVEPQLYAAEGIRAKRKQPESLDAWECVMRALSCVNSRSQNDYAMARELLERAIELDPAYAQAHALFAYVMGLEVLYGWKSEEIALARALEAAQKAV